MPVAVGVMADSYNKPAAGGWQALLYDYWDGANAVAGSPLATTNGLVPSTIPVSTVTADGFLLSSTQSIANTNTLINGVAVVVKCVGLAPGSATILAQRIYTGGWILGVKIDWASPPNYLHCPMDAGGGGTGIAPIDRDVARSLTTGVVGVYASGKDGVNVATRIVPDDGPGLYERATFTGTGPASINLQLTNAAYNLRYQLIGLTTGRPSAELMAALVAAFA